MRAIADKIGALLMIDMAHPAGLIAAGLLNNPLKYAHIVTSTTHKTLRGPRGGIILMGKDFENPWGLTTPKGEIKMMSALLDSAVFPGMQGGPLEHVIAAKAVAFKEALAPEFKAYQQQVVKNAQASVLETIYGVGTDITIRELAETIARLQAYSEAGADCLYAPGIKSREEITQRYYDIGKLVLTDARRPPEHDRHEREDRAHPLGHGGAGRADEVEAVMPDAVSVHSNGFKMVDYAKLGIVRQLH